MKYRGHCYKTHCYRSVRPIVITFLLVFFDEIQLKITFRLLTYVCLSLNLAMLFCKFRHQLLKNVTKRFLLAFLDNDCYLSKYEVRH